MATSSVLQQYGIHDFLNWHASGELILNPDFQRRSVWTPQAKVLLIDTILRGLPVPKIFIRTQVDPRTKKTVREVVDGQQRLRAITEFANNEFTLTARAKEFSGLNYDRLDDEQKQDFLSYALATDQLLNASDTDVLDIFARLNSYTVSLNAAEKRHAAFQGDFKWAVHEASLYWKTLWEDFNIITGRDRLRMGDDALMAELFGFILEGVPDGGATTIDRLYKRYDDHFESEELTRKSVDRVIRAIIEHFGSILYETPLRRSPQFAMLFAAMAHALIGIPQGKLDYLPPRKRVLTNIESSRAELLRLAAALERTHPSEAYQEFVEASAGSTQRIATRKVRFRYYWNALIAN